MKLFGKRPSSPPVVSPPESEEEVSADQTHFGEELSVLVDSVTPLQEPAKVVKKRSLDRRLIIVTVLGLLFVFLVVLLVLAQSVRPERVRPTPPPRQETEQDELLTELEKRLRQVEADVEQADPYQQELAFPPVDFQTDLEDATQVQLEANRRAR